MFCKSKIELDNCMHTHTYKPMVYTECTQHVHTIDKQSVVTFWLNYKKKTVIDLPRQVIFLSCSAFFAWYFCWSSLSWNKTISSFKTRYWGHTWSRSKGRVIHLLLEVFSVWYQCGIKSTKDSSTGMERMVAERHLNSDGIPTYNWIMRAPSE